MLPVFFFEVGVNIHACGNRAEQEHDDRQRGRTVVGQILVELVEQRDTQHLRGVAAHQVRGSERTDVGHEYERACDDDVLEGQRQDHGGEHLELACADITSSLDDAVRDRAQTGGDHHCRKRNVEPEVHDDHAACVVHQAELEVHAEVQTDAVDETGVADDRDHGVNRAHCRYETRQEVQRADALCDARMDEAQIERQQVRNDQRDDDGRDNDEQRVQDVHALCRLGEEVCVVCERESAGLFILKALDDSGNDRILFKEKRGTNVAVTEEFS